MLVTKEGMPCAAISLRAGATSLERHAAEELRRYLRGVSGANVPIGEASEPTNSIIAVGNPIHHPLVASATKRGLLTPPEAEPDRDTFIVQTVSLDGRDVLVLGGSTERGTLYAVYHFIEHVLDVGFFRDGERIPRTPTVRIPALKIVERPYFSEREDGNGCIFSYSCSAWTIDDWRRELDWKSKRRVTSTWPFNVGGDIVNSILADWGVPVEKPKPRAKPTVHEQAHEYARFLGIRLPCALPNGYVPDAFYRVFPDSRTLVLQWSELPPYRLLHPADPRFKQLLVEFIRRHTKQWGSDHLYIAEFASESRVIEGATNIQEVRLIFARIVSEAIQEADPAGVWVPSSWTFDLDAQNANRWTPEDVRQYLDAMSVKHVVWDLWSEERAKYLDTDYFFGHPWGFGVLHSFGAGSYLHGDAAGLVERVHGLLKEPRANRCELFLVQSEIIHFNSFFYELCAQLSWDPRRVEIGSFVAWYCRKRYGDEAGKKLEPAWRLLLETVYGPESGTVGTMLDPLYWYRPDLALLLGWKEDKTRTTEVRARRPAFIAKLRRALDKMLAREEIFRENEMARRDLVDVARHWIAERFNLALIGGRDAFLAGDEKRLDSAARECLRLLDEQVRLLASWPPYRLDRKVERERINYGDDAVKAVKHIHVWVYPFDNESPPLRDYYRMDLDGLVADYYKPRVAAYFDLLHRKLAAGERTVADEEWEALYRPIEDAFIASPLRLLPEGEDPVMVVREIVAAAK